MKVFNKVSWLIPAILGIMAIVLFFSFNVLTADLGILGKVNLNGWQATFGSEDYDQVTLWLVVALILIVIGIIFSILGLSDNKFAMLVPSGSMIAGSVMLFFTKSFHLNAALSGVEGEVARALIESAHSFFEPDMGVYLGGIIGLVGGLMALFSVIPKVLEK